MFLATSRIRSIMASLSPVMLGAEARGAARCSTAARNPEAQAQHPISTRQAAERMAENVLANRRNLTKGL